MSSSYKSFRKLTRNSPSNRRPSTRSPAEHSPCGCWAAPAAAAGPPHVHSADCAVQTESPRRGASSVLCAADPCDNWDSRSWSSRFLFTHNMGVKGRAVKIDGSSPRSGVIEGFRIVCIFNYGFHLLNTCDL